MPNSTTFPNGQTLVSSALSQNDLNKILQALTLQIFAIDPTTDPLAYSKVRVAWQGQPGWALSDDVCSNRPHRAGWRIQPHPRPHRFRKR
jgi:hypothetical protein